MSEDSDPDVGLVDVEEDSDDGGDEGIIARYDDGDGHARNGSDYIDEDIGNDPTFDLPTDCVGGSTLHDEPLNERARHPRVLASIGIFDWMEFDGEPPLESNHEANDL